MDQLRDAGRETAALLEPFDRWDLLQRLAGLQLIPENAQFTLRLEALASLVASDAGRIPAPQMSQTKFKALVEGSPLVQAVAHLEDPIENYFSVPIGFYGGEYLVQPGTTLGVIDAVEGLAQVVMSRPSDIPRPLLGRVRDVLSAALVLSDAISRRAGLRRYEMHEPVPESPTHPAPDTRRRLSEAVVFHREELAALARSHDAPGGSIELLRSLMGHVDFGAYSPESGPLLLRPVVARGDKLLVAIPGMLVPAALQAAQHLFKEAGAESLWLRHMIGSYTERAWGALERLGCVHVADSLTGREDYAQGEFQLDVDRRLIVGLAVNDLAGMSAETYGGQFDLGNQSDFGRALASDICRQSPDVECTYLLLFASSGGSVMIGFNDTPDSPLALEHVMPFRAFEMLCALEEGHPLRLYYYVRDRKLLAESSRVLVMDELDAYGVYRENGSSFYMSDSARPTFMSFTSGSGIVVLRDWAKKSDEHIVATPRNGVQAKVIRRWADTTIGVYALSTRQPGVLCVETDSALVWLMVLPFEPEQRMMASQLCDAIAFWLWRVASTRPEFKTHDPITLTVELDDWPGWMNQQDEWVNERASMSRVCSADGQSGRVILRRGVPSADDVRSESGELEIASELLVCCCELLQMPRSFQPREAVTAVQRQHPCAILTRLSLEENPAADTRGLPQPILVEPAEVSFVLDWVGRRTAELLETDPDAQLLNTAVDEIYRRLSAMMEALSPAALPDILVRAEALAAFAEQNRISLQNRLACFGDVADLHSKVISEVSEESTAAIACRFLVELGTCALTGTEELSRARFDEMMALSSQLVLFGMESDLEFYDLAELNPVMLPSGRLGRDGAAFEKAAKEYSAAYLEQELAPVVRPSIGVLDVPASTSVEAALAGVMNAFADEFGFTIASLGEAVQVLTEVAHRGDSVITCTGLDSLRTALGERLPATEVQAFVEALCLRSRANYLEPAGGSTSDVFPWRFARALSYARRPIVVQDGGGKALALYGRRHLIRSVRLLLSSLEVGRYKAKSSAMKAALGALNNARGREFNEKVAAAIRGIHGLRVFERFTGLGGVGMPADLGDIDVLVIIPRSKLLLALECKRLSRARTPAEISNEMANLIRGAAGKKSGAEKHARRVQWVERNKVSLLAEAGVPARGQWRVEGLIVVDTEPMSKYLEQSLVPIVSLDGVIARAQT